MGSSSDTPLNKQMRGKQPTSLSLSHTLPHCLVWTAWLRVAGPSTLGRGLPDLLPYSKNPHGSIKLHLLHPAGRLPRTHVPTEPGTLLANISEGRLRAMLEPAISSFICQSLRVCLWEGLLCTSHCASFNPTATNLFGKLWQHLGPVCSSEHTMEDKSPLFEAISLAL